MSVGLDFSYWPRETRGKIPRPCADNPIASAERSCRRWVRKNKTTRPTTQSSPIQKTDLHSVNMPLVCTASQMPAKIEPMPTTWNITLKSGSYRSRPEFPRAQDHQPDEINDAVAQKQIPSQPGQATAMRPPCPWRSTAASGGWSRTGRKRTSRIKIAALMRRINPAQQATPPRRSARARRTAEMRLITTDSLHMKTSSPSSVPATQPDTTQMAFSHSRVSSFNSSMPSISMLLPRDTMNASRPQPIAAAKDWPTSTRHATLPMGRMNVQNQDRSPKTDSLADAGCPHKKSRCKARRNPPVSAPAPASTDTPPTPRRT